MVCLYLHLRPLEADGGRNFELPRVKSINTSGHKFGLVYAGVGWIIWRDQAYLPKHLVFELHYLGGTEESYTLNFSRPGGQIIAQYFNLIHLGFEGYKGIMENSMANARLLSKALEATGWYTCVSDIHRKKGAYSFGGVKEAVFGKEGETSADYNAGLPVVAFTFSDEFKEEFSHIKQVSVSNLLRAKQYIVPSESSSPSRARHGLTPQTIPFHPTRRRRRSFGWWCGGACRSISWRGSSATSSP